MHITRYGHDFLLHFYASQHQASSRSGGRSSSDKGTYGSTGNYYQYQQTAHIEQANGQSVQLSLPEAPHFTHTIGTVTRTHSLTPPGQEGYNLIPWSLNLNTDQGATGDTISLNLHAFYNARDDSETAFTLELTAPDAALDAQLLGFKWDASMGGDATGMFFFNYSWGGFAQITDLQEIVWSRAVLSHNPADLAPVPVPATALLFGSGLVGLLAGGLRKRKAG